MSFRISDAGHEIVCNYLDSNYSRKPKKIKKTEGKSHFNTARRVNSRKDRILKYDLY